MTQELALAASRPTASADIDGEYRYTLSRVWDETLPMAVFVMLNPSKADAQLDDPTIRKCIGFARALGYGGIIVVNLFALRATDPKELRKHPFPVGPRNAAAIDEVVRKHGPTGIVICAWGSNVAAKTRAPLVLARLRAMGVQLCALRISKKSQCPEHPLYLPYELKPVAM